MFFGTSSAIFGNSRDYYLSIGVNKSWFWALFAFFDILGPKKGHGLKTQLDKHLVTIWGHLLSRNHVSNSSDLGTPLNIIISIPLV